MKVIECCSPTEYAHLTVQAEYPPIGVVCPSFSVISCTEEELEGFTPVAASETPRPFNNDAACLRALLGG